jgi:prepilin-type N-terminal cleavage/methylation domain-containing protein
MTRSPTYRGAQREDGFTLPELLIATVVGLFLIGSTATLFARTASTEPRARDRAAQIQQARVMSERLTRELRQASDATTLPTTCTGLCPGLSVLAFVPSTPSCDGTARTDTSTASRCRVFYFCSAAGSCTRTECPPTVTATATPTDPPCSPTLPVIEGLTSNQVFSFSPRTPGHSYISFALGFAAESGGDAITIEDGAALRNPPLGGAS